MRILLPKICLSLISRSVCSSKLFHLLLFHKLVFLKQYSGLSLSGPSSVGSLSEWAAVRGSSNLGRALLAFSKWASSPNGPFFWST